MERELRYHTTVTSGLQGVARLARLSPLYVPVTVPVAKAAQVAARQAQRYPSITQAAGTRTALRRAGYPAVQLVTLPPRDSTVTLVLLSGLEPTNGREVWQDSRDPQTPLRWGPYELSTSQEGSVTWRLSQERRAHYRRRLTRLIVGQGLPGGRVIRLPDDVARLKVEGLAQHLLSYPGLSGVREDYDLLRRHAERTWASTRSRASPPCWPYKAYLPFLRPHTAAMTQLPSGDDHAESQAAQATDAER